MKRFFFEEEGDDESDDEMMDEEARAFPEMVPEFFAMTHGLDNPDQQILNYSIRVCEQTFLWRFRSTKQKIEMIENVFESLKTLVDSGRNMN